MTLPSVSMPNDNVMKSKRRRSFTSLFKKLVWIDAPIAIASSGLTVLLVNKIFYKNIY
jgi:hypothetical protein